MAEPTPSALALARLRALGTAPAQVSPAASTAARAAGRRIVTASAAGAQIALLAWPDDIDLTEQSDNPLWTTPPTALQLTFAACVRLCWADPRLHPYPGRTVAPEAIFALLARVNARPAAHEAIPIFDNAPKRSLSWLRRTAWIDQDDAGVRFGARLATLPDDEVAALRRVFEAMPDPEETSDTGSRTHPRMDGDPGEETPGAGPVDGVDTLLPATPEEAADE